MLNQSIQTLIESKLLDFSKIEKDRLSVLENLAQTIQQNLEHQQACSVTVICTHNSRRSQLGQVLIQLAADYYNIKSISAYSGGTEVSEFNIRMVNALIRCGFNVQKNDQVINPEYSISWGDNGINHMQSRLYNDAYNPSSNFIAIMVCDHADQNCPFVSGASKRISLPYTDPKQYDDSTNEAKAYDDKIIEMGQELFYMMKHVSTLQ
ncbi:MAG: hypothetical protein IT245_04200 [Bacteroidia bacterium]|nr:hypothetical protein [Bacteroidia bacterium]